MSLPAHGVNVLGDWAVNDSNCQALRLGGASYLRLNFSPDKGLKACDALMYTAAKNNCPVLPILIYRPPGTVAAPPVTKQQWGVWNNWIEACAARYGPGGTFWTAHQDVTARPVKVWEIWNEQNLSVFWGRRKPDVAEYFKVLTRARHVLRSVDPTARVMLGGLSARGFARWTDAYLDADDDADQAFDAFGFHPYEPNGRLSILDVRRLRELLDDSDVDAPIWITEVGWGTLGVPSRYATSEAGQAKRLARFLAGMRKRRAEWNIGAVFVYQLQDELPAHAWYLGAGVLGPNRAPKPSWQALTRSAAAAPTVELPPLRS